MVEEIEHLIKQIGLVSGSLGSINLHFQFGEIGKFNLAGPAPEGVNPATWKSLQERVQSLNGQIQSFARHQGHRMVIERPTQQLRKRRG